MHVVIKDISQALSLETGQSYSFLSLMLPNGKTVRATVSDDTIAEITQLFMYSGSPAAQAAAQRASEPQAEVRVEDAVSQVLPASMHSQAVGSYAPLELTEDGDGELVETFGGNFNPEEDPELAEVGAALRNANERMANAIGDTATPQPGELRRIVDNLTHQEPVMPVPSVMTTKPTSVRQLSKPVVEADAMGYPIVKGAGLVDPRGIMGGNTDGEEDAGQV